LTKLTDEQVQAIYTQQAADAAAAQAALPPPPPDPLTVLQQALITKGMLTPTDIASAHASLMASSITVA
jgi:hypothetical protein